MDLPISKPQDIKDPTHIKRGIAKGMKEDRNTKDLESVSSPISTLYPAIKNNGFLYM